MQDKYAGDIGDFGKYGLLRWLCGDRSDGRQLRLAVIWYYVETDGPLPPPGPAFDYIFNPSGREQLLRDCDQELFQLLSALVLQNRRTVADIETSGTLPGDTVFFREPVPVVGRDAWFERAVLAMRDCDVAFLDPDKGLADEPSVEHATYAEVAKTWERDKSLVIYQSFNRNGTHAAQIQDYAGRLRTELGIVGPPGAIIALRFGVRLPRVFFVIPNPAKPEIAGLLRERVASFMESCWGTGRDPHFTCVDC